MKIVQVNTSTEGGAAEAALRLHMALLELNIDSNFLALYKAQCNLNRVYDFRDELGILESLICKIKNKLQVNRNMKLSLTANELFSEITSAWTLQNHSLIKNSDIVHLHWISHFVNVPEVLSLSKNIVWTLHDHFLFSGGFHYPPLKNSNVSQELINEQKRIVAEIIKKHPITIVCPSEHLMLMAKNSGILDGCNFYTIKNPVDTKLFAPKNTNDTRLKLHIPENEKVLLFLSDIIDYPRKGFSYLEKALHLLDENITLLVAGKGKLPGKIGNAKVKQFGFVNDKSLLIDLYNSCDVLVNPSLNDISSNTIIEAMACGKPVVAFNSGGIPELITDRNGILVNIKTPEALAEGIKKAFETNFNAEEIRQKAKLEHAFEVIAPQYMKVYNEISK